MSAYTSLLSLGNWRSYNTKLAKSVGVNESILLSELCYKLEYWITNNGLTDDGYFYLTIEDCELDTALSRKQQDTAIKNLMSLQLIDVVRRPANGGVSPVRHFKVYEDRVVQMLQVELTKKDNLNCPKSTTTNKQDTNNKTNNINNDTIVLEIIDFMNSTWNTKFRSNNTSTKKLIVSLLKNYTVDDIKNVIVHKYYEWGANPYPFSNGSLSSTYLRPVTIFGSKFESYLQAANSFISSKATFKQQKTISSFNNVTNSAISKQTSEDKSNMEF